MNILVVCTRNLPPKTYGGTERVVWSLIKGLHQLGHHVYILSSKPIQLDWITSIVRIPALPIETQIPDEIDIIHFHMTPSSSLLGLKTPSVFTQHGNKVIENLESLDPNTIFVSQKHALNHGAEAFVYNGLDWDDYHHPSLDKNNRQERFHFLGKAAWRVKNLQGAIDITRRANATLDVLGGHRLNLKMGFRLTLDRHVKFHGMVDNSKKCKVLEKSKGLIFPVTWEEPFGLAITESLFMGSPVFATQHGSLPEIIKSDSEIGFLSNNEAQLVDAIRHNSYDPKVCHEYARDVFDHISMTKSYLKMYEKVLNGEKLNQFNNKAITKFKRLDYQK